MNRRLRRLALAYLILGVPLLYDYYKPPIQKEDVFKHDEHKEKCIGELTLEYINNRGYFARGEYDFDGNGKVDVVAFYKIESEDFMGKYYSNPLACFLWNDKDENGLIRYVLEDSDNNGTLEKPLKGGELKEFLKDLNEPREYEA